MNKKKKIVYLFLFVLVIVIALIIVVFKTKKQVIDEEETLKPRDLYEEFMESGVLYPRNRIEIVSLFDGIIEKICVNEGDLVKKGQVLFWLSSIERAVIVDAAMVSGESKNCNKWGNTFKATPVLAPIDGFIIHRIKEPKQTVGFRENILVMADDLIVCVNINEIDLKHIKIGSKVNMYLDAYPEIEFEGIVEHISYESLVINNIVLYMVKIKPINKLEMFRSGMSVTVMIPISSKKNALSIPIKFISEEGQKKIVIVKMGNGRKPAFCMREVKTGVSDGRFIEIVSGLNIAEKVVTFKSK
ncbi:MAG: HlyD family efflux transporter periplasmic adaptor subunit [Endomicrobium sp.]|jgi:macrolide-specific efflux system membrane fusion protein|nr:HlyD family efflux transporter periplasmic adaptor subunit [Endomicrobium sp.]